MPSVKVATSIGSMDGGSIRAMRSRYSAPRILGCMSKLMSEGQLEGRDLDHGELTGWTDVN